MAQAVQAVASGSGLLDTTPQFKDFATQWVDEHILFSDLVQVISPLMILVKILGMGVWF